MSCGNTPGDTDSLGPVDVLSPDTAGDDVSGQDAGIDTDVSVDTVAHVPDVQNEDAGIDAGLPADVVADVPTDIVAADIAGDCPGGYLCPCETEADCISRLCVVTLDGSVCSRTCLYPEDCSSGWSCELGTDAGEAVGFVCHYRFESLCRPCMDHSDCVPPLGAGEGIFKCLHYDNNGSYCGTPCEETSDCPDGYECRSYVDDAESYSQCVPESGKCDCDDVHVGDLTSCSIENEFGTCRAVRTCDEPCPARTPAAEICDDIDNDCDGTINDNVPDLPCQLTDSFGTCQGVAKCGIGDTEYGECEGTCARSEACDNSPERR